VQKSLNVHGCHIYDAAGVCYACKGGYNLFKNYCLFPNQISEVLQEVTTLEAILAKQKGNSGLAPPVSPPAPNDSGFSNSDFGGFGDTSSFGGDSSNFGGSSSFGDSGFDIGSDLSGGFGNHV
jgi:hypothetical protein